MNISVKPYGTLSDGREAKLYTLENNNGMSASITNFGGVIVNLMVPDKNGNLADVVLAHKGLEQYVGGNPGSFGAVIGRNANRVKGAIFESEGQLYPLETNNGENNLHTGKGGLQFRLFDAEITADEDGARLLLTCLVPHLDDKFPGNFTAEVAYTLDDTNTLMIEYHAVSDRETLVNLTNHTYFNLAGHDSGAVYGHELQMNSSFYTPASPANILTGEVLSVEGTPMDFRNSTALGEPVQGSFEQIKQFGGIDHNFMLDGSGYRKVATLADPASGRVMHTFTDLPAVQVYTGNNLPNSCPEKGESPYAKNGGICLETQTVPNAAQMPWLASPVYEAEQEYFSTTAYQFEVK